MHEQLGIQCSRLPYLYELLMQQLRNLLIHRIGVRKLTAQTGLTLEAKYSRPTSLSNDRVPSVLSFRAPSNHMAFWQFAPIITA